jgi:hypothetical protein
MHAKAMSHGGDHDPRVKVGWTVKDPEIAQVNEAGQLIPLKSGITEVTAAHGKVSATVPVEVLFAEKMTVEPKELTFSEGQEPVELTVRTYDFRGRELRDRTPIFKSLNPEVVSMGQNAAFPVNPGTAEVEVRIDELVQKVAVKVEAGKTARRK